MITITATPSTLNSVYQPIRFELESDKTNPELRVRCDVFARLGSQGSYIKIASPTKDKEGLNFKFSLHKQLNSMLEISVPIANNGDVNEDLTSIVQFKCTFTELIYDSDELYEDADTLDSSPYHATNCIIQSQEPVEVDDFVCDNDQARFLTDQPKEIDVYIGQLTNLFYMYAPDAPVTPLITYETDSSSTGVGAMLIGSTFIVQ